MSTTHAKLRCRRSLAGQHGCYVGENRARRAAGVCRRNYTAIFDRIERTPALMESPGVVLTLIGHGNLHIPDALHGKVVKRASLAYQVQPRHDLGL